MPYLVFVTTPFAHSCISYYQLIRAFGQKGLIHYELDFSSWDNPNDLHKTSSLYIQRGIDGYGLREELKIPESNMFLEELEIFANTCLTGSVKQLSAENANIAVAMVYSALKSVDNNLIFLTAAYNGGPGNLKKWQNEIIDRYVHQITC